MRRLPRSKRKLGPHFPLSLHEPGPSCRTQFLNPENGARQELSSLYAHRPAPGNLSPIPIKAAYSSCLHQTIINNTNTQFRGRQTFSIKDQTVNTLGLKAKWSVILLISATVMQKHHGQYINEWKQLSCETFFVDTEIWLLCNFHVILFFFWFFPYHKNIKTILNSWTI